MSAWAHDPRVRAWGRGELLTYNTPDYLKKSIKSQDAAMSSIRNGEDMHAIHANMQKGSSLKNASGVQDLGANSTRADIDDERGRQPGPTQSRLPANKTTSAWAKGPPQIPPKLTQTQTKANPKQPHSNAKGQVWSADDLKAMVERDTNAPLLKSGTTVYHAQSFGSWASGKAPTAPESQDRPSAATNYLPPQARPGQAKKSGKSSISIKFDTPHPCTYDSCDRGFQKSRELKKHKDEVHPWCRVCSLDFETEEDLLQHKIQTEEMHICCQHCGEDFRSSGGRDIHVRQFHKTSQECVCPGCGLIFERGAGLISHVWSSKCKNFGGEFAGGVNEFLFRECRAKACLQLTTLANRDTRAVTSKMVEDIQPKDDVPSQAVSQAVSQKISSAIGEAEGGGVLLPDQNLLDEPADSGDERIQDALLPSKEVDVSSSAKGKGKEMDEWPTAAKSSALAKFKLTGDPSELQKLQDEPSPTIPLHKVSEVPAPIDYDHKPIPARLEKWPEPDMPDWRRTQMFHPEQVKDEELIRTDWDWADFQPHPFDGQYHCPFDQCKATYPYVITLKIHLTSGYHQGTHNACPKCLKTFGSPVAQIAHVESNSCNIQIASDFAELLHVISGGFLGVSGYHADGSAKIEVPMVPAERRPWMQIEEDEDVVLGIERGEKREDKDVLVQRVLEKQKADEEAEELAQKEEEEEREREKQFLRDQEAENFRAALDEIANRQLPSIEEVNEPRNETSGTSWELPHRRTRRIRRGKVVAS